jgi:hypothetical protein
VPIYALAHHNTTQRIANFEKTNKLTKAMKIKYYNEAQACHEPHAYSLKHYVENTKVHATYFPNLNLHQNYMTSWIQSQQQPLKPLN